MTLSPELEALKNEAVLVTCEQWADRQGWTLRKEGLAELVGPCPVCGGKDRFAINGVKNAWLCRECGVGGDVIFLVMHTQDVKFKEACELLAGRTAAAPVDAERARRLQDEAEAAARRREAEAQDYREKARKRAHEIWVERASPAEAHDPMVMRLGQRGIPLAALTTPAIMAAGGIRSLRQALYHDYVTEVKRGDRKSWEKLHCGPAQLACVQGPDGRFGAIHQTWIDLGRAKGNVELLHPVDLDKHGQPEKLPAKKVLGVKKGGAIRLFTPAGATRLVMGEGIETTLTPLAHAFTEGTAYWCGVDLGNMSGRALRDGGKLVHDQPDMADDECFLPPDWVAELIYLVDETDEPQKHIREKIVRGLRRARRMRERARLTRPELPALTIKAAEPDDAGMDFNDLAMVGDADEGAD